MIIFTPFFILLLTLTQHTFVTLQYLLTTISTLYNNNINITLFHLYLYNKAEYLLITTSIIFTTTGTLHLPYFHYYKKY